ncbi:MAG: FadR/GntR family transcriptional regulator [Anaerolineae bacterium]
MPLRPVETKKVYMRVVEQIRSLIESGELRPGDQLPTTQELAEALRVSRPSVREALAALEIVGLVETRPGAGCFVKEPPPLQEAHAARRAIELGWASAEDILEARLAYEPMCARLAALRRTEEDLREMRCSPELAMVDIERVAAGLPARFQNCSTRHPLPPENFNLSLHAIIARASKNPVLAMFGEAVAQAVQSPTWQRMMRQIYLSPRNAGFFLKHYETLYDAVERGDAELAESTMRQHLLALSATLNE